MSAAHILPGKYIIESIAYPDRVLTVETESYKLFTFPKHSSSGDMKLAFRIASHYE
ncbi:hypothetical protein Clacol_000202 [Clathrus columnatus]|uniref:Uncharacterized protein n=1 Tax=Clathrus columnatus TaxID=1419009 RepID=A0AAV4ZWS4_9AGAM|nr:hypothetical protein Clacol_000202 [Clathrus columnatus]